MNCSHKLVFTFRFCVEFLCTRAAAAFDSSFSRGVRTIRVPNGSIFQDDLRLALDHDVLALLATTFPYAYELTAHINPRSDHASGPVSCDCGAMPTAWKGMTSGQVRL
eukprot:COSAG02_NODE_4471_length_5328_cov_3.132721_8_plen_108_part_00